MQLEWGKTASSARVRNAAKSAILEPGQVKGHRDNTMPEQKNLQILSLEKKKTTFFFQILNFVQEDESSAFLERQQKKIRQTLLSTQ